MARIRSIKPELWQKVEYPWLHGHALYVVQEGRSQYFKIGHTANPWIRVSALQGGNHRKLHLRAVFTGPRYECQKIERAALRCLVRARVGKEWVHAPLAEIVATIKFLAEVPADA